MNKISNTGGLKPLFRDLFWICRSSWFFSLASGSTPRRGLIDSRLWNYSFKSLTSLQIILAQNGVESRITVRSALFTAFQSYIFPVLGLMFFETTLPSRTYFTTTSWIFDDKSFVRLYLLLVRRVLTSTLYSSCVLLRFCYVFQEYHNFGVLHGASGRLEFFHKSLGSLVYLPRPVKFSFKSFRSKSSFTVGLQSP